MRLLLAVFLAVTSAGLVATPAVAATAGPTISAPASTAGYQTVAITGTATPGATVELYESAYQFHALQPALYWQDGSNAPITTTAAANGSYRMTRWVDTGFEFAVVVDGVMSRTVVVRNRVVPILTVVSGKAGTVTARIVETPAQPWLTVRIERKNADGTWSAVARGYTLEHGVWSVVVKQTSRRTYTYRAWVGGDTESALLAAYSTAHAVKIR
ncbi:hypothetical protein AB0M54_23800 [Actinoplanes sp. NPDC051470]|uniref:hypothetical protein n=1 Tax=unclassified Actinoplanes TaxID=2626549 RepID=UPI0034211EB6